MLTMKKILTILVLMCACLNFATAQSYISSDTDIILEAGSLTKYSSPNIVVTGTFQTRAARWVVTLGVSSGATANEPIFAEYTMIITQAEVDLYSGSGAGDTAKAQNSLEQAVGGYLGALNVSTTFTIH
jgi:hypothetical protein